MKYKLKPLGYPVRMGGVEESGPRNEEAWEVVDLTGKGRKFDSYLWKNNSGRYQFFFERFYAKDLNEALEKVTEIIDQRSLMKDLKWLESVQGMAEIHVYKNHEKDLPCGFAHVDGKKTGIRGIRLGKNIAFEKGQCKIEWTKEQFWKKVLEIVKCEDQQVHELESELQPEFLQQFFVVIDTDDMGELSTEMLREYLEHPLGPKPSKIDEVFVVAPYGGDSQNRIALRVRWQTNHYTRFIN